MTTGQAFRVVVVKPTAGQFIGQTLLVIDQFKKEPMVLPFVQQHVSDEKQGAGNVLFELNPLKGSRRIFIAKAAGPSAPEDNLHMFITSEYMPEIGAQVDFIFVKPNVGSGTIGIEFYLSNFPMLYRETGAAGMVVIFGNEGPVTGTMVFDGDYWTLLNLSHPPVSIS